jgi:hypothetical protein
LILVRFPDEAGRAIITSSRRFSRVESGGNRS